MSIEERCRIVERKIKARTKPNGDAKPGFEQNVATLRAELRAISRHIEYAKQIVESSDEHE